MIPAEIIVHFNMQPHPEGGHFVETYRHAPDGGGRGASTAIYYLLEKGQKSHWHRVIDADEVWHYYAGDGLRLRHARYDTEEVIEWVIGNDLSAGQVPQAVIPAGDWQAAEPLGEWCLVGCTVAPAFEFETFEMAEPDWEPNG